MNFLGRAKRFFQELASEPESKVQYFNVRCASGHRVRGERTEGYQALRCPACGEGVFVLPRSPLPEPVAPGRSPAAARTSQGRAWVDEGPVELTDPGRTALEVGNDESSPADAEIIWEDPSPTSARRPRQSHAPGPGPAATSKDEPFWEEDLSRAAAPTSTEKAERRRKKPSPEDGSATEGDRPAGSSAAAPSNKKKSRRTVPEAAVIEVESRRKKPGGITAILVVVPLLVTTAVAWRYWRQVRADYPLRAELGKTEGIPALDEGNFAKAHQILSAAKSAVDALGAAGEDADKIRQAADEAAIFVNLSPETLEEMLETAGRTDPQLWESKFHDLYKGRTILIDSTISEEPGDGPSARYSIEYLILPPGGANNFTDGRVAAPDLKGLIDFTGFRLFDLARPRKGNRVRFGATLATFQFDHTTNIYWLGLEPDSGVFINHTAALEALGWPRAAETDVSPESPP